MRIGVPASANTDVSDRVARALGEISIADSYTRILGISRPEILGRLAAAQAYAISGDFGAVASTYNAGSIYNPAASGVVLVPYFLTYSIATAGSIHGGTNAVDIQCPQVTPVPLRPGGAASITIARMGNAPAKAALRTHTVYVPANTPQFFHREPFAYLPAGTGFQFSPDGEAVGMQASLHWMEF